MHELLNEKVLTYNAWSIEGVEACMSSQWTFWQWTLWGNTFLQVFNNIKVARKDPVCSFEWRSVHETINLNKISQSCYPQTVHSPLFFPDIYDLMEKIGYCEQSMLSLIYIYFDCKFTIMCQTKLLKGIYPEKKWLIDFYSEILIDWTFPAFHFSAPKQ